MTSVSVRTLRFYDRIGLLKPTARSESGYRLYRDADLPRLQQILALKFLGFSLDEIQRFLTAPPVSLREALAQQSAMLRRQRSHLNTVIRATEQAERVLHTEDGNLSALVDVIQAIQMTQNNDWQKQYFTDEQLKVMAEISDASYSDEAKAALAERQAQSPWTEEDQRKVDAQYAELYAGVKQAVATGAAADSPEAQALAGKAIGLIEAFTMGNPAIAAGLQNFWKTHQAMAPEQRPYKTPLTDDEAAFLEKAKAIFIERRGTGAAS